MAKIISFPGGEDITPPDRKWSPGSTYQFGKGRVIFGDREYPVKSFTIEQERPEITNRIVDIEAKGTFTLDPPPWMSDALGIPYHEWIEPTIDPTVSKWKDEPLWLKEIPYRGSDLGTRYHKAFEDNIERDWADRRYFVIDESPLPSSPEVTSPKFDLSAFNLPPKANLPITNNTPEWARDKHAREQRNRKKVNHYLDFESYSRVPLTRPVYETTEIFRPAAYSRARDHMELTEKLLQPMRDQMRQLQDDMFMSFLLAAFIEPEPMTFVGPASCGKTKFPWLDPLVPIRRDNVIKFGPIT